jgi:hypothetical protein
MRAKSYNPVNNCVECYCRRHRAFGGLRVFPVCEAVATALMCVCVCVCVFVCVCARAHHIHTHMHTRTHALEETEVRARTLPYHGILFLFLPRGDSHARLHACTGVPVCSHGHARAAGATEGALQGSVCVGHKQSSVPV